MKIMHIGNFRGFSIAIAMAAFILVNGCSTAPKLGAGKGNTVTGAAGGETTEGANTALEHCDNTLGTLAMVEDQTAAWWFELRQHKLGSTIPVIRLMVQQSNCFVVVERGKAMKNMMMERQFQQSGEMRGGSSFGKGQIVAADYSLSPEISFSGNTGGGGLGIGGGLLGAVVGLAASFKANEASTTLILVDNRSSVQISASMGSAKNFDFGMLGGLFGSGGGALGGAYSKTPQGKVIVAAFADSYNKMIKSLRNYKAQQVKGGLGTGGTLGVSGGAEHKAKSKVAEGQFVTSARVNMRAGSNGKAKILTKLSKNTVVVPTGNKKGKWWEVEANGLSGWVHSAYITK